ncbi:MAG: GGDEF domain-containing protein [Pyrinomonadaceae bacterium]|nr:GGDEF domain-containing protein [Pyrinomonadaceae bacterium]
MLNDLIADGKALLKKVRAHYTAPPESLPLDQQVTVSELEAWYRGVSLLLERNFGKDSVELRTWQDRQSEARERSWEGVGRRSPDGGSFVVELLAASIGTLTEIKTSRIGIDSGPSMNTEIDELVQLFRRGAFDQNLAEAITSCEQMGEPLSLIMADVDKFKSVNDTHGHPSGDEVLQIVAKIVKQIVGAKGTCYRYGGEEISILLPNYTADEAGSLAERIRIAISSSPIGSKQLSVSVSFGIGDIPTHARTPSELLKAADAALYEAKNFGRNLVRISGEPKPDKSKVRHATRKQPDPNTLSEKEAETIRVHYFTYHHAFCPRDGSRLRIDESYPADQQTPTLVILCPLCGLDERLHGLKRNAESVG